MGSAMPGATSAANSPEATEAKKAPKTKPHIVVERIVSHLASAPAVQPANSSEPFSGSAAAPTAAAIRSDQRLRPPVTPSGAWRPKANTPSTAKATAPVV
ncbi:MAG: hypothetical protein U0531_10325 [Dehalococcoidia bacterium]